MGRYNKENFRGFHMEPDRVNIDKVYIWEPLNSIYRNGLRVSSILKNFKLKDRKEEFLFFDTDSESTAVFRFAVNDAGGLESGVAFLPFSDAEYLYEELEKITWKERE